MLRRLVLLLLVLERLAVGSLAGEKTSRAPRKAYDREEFQKFVESHCLECHDKANHKGGLALEEQIGAGVEGHAELWENVVHKLRSRQMPPPGSQHPDEQACDGTIAWLESSLDAAAAAHPQPGRTDTLRRLNRTEYQNTIRDLLALDVDVSALLPADESSHGLDNVTVTDLSPTLLNRYVSAAQKISRLAVGRGLRSPAGETFRIRPDVTQDMHVEGSPLGTRGGTAFVYTFPRDGEYEIQIHLMRDRNDEIESLREPHELEVALDRERIELFTIKPQKGGSDRTTDSKRSVRVTTTAGPHKLSVAFLKKPSLLLETERQPLNVHYNFYRHPRIGPAVYEITVIGPFASSGPGESPSRRKIFVAAPNGREGEEACARLILTDLTRRAYRRPVTDDDLKTPLSLYRQGNSEGGFDAGIELALVSVLTNPQFLFRIERDPPELPKGEAYRIDGLELASRLSYFLWSSAPDAELLNLGANGELRRPDVLEAQVRRLLADERSRSLVSNFAGQWLYLRNLEAVVPDMRLFPDFDDNLRQAFRRETELFFESIIREDRSVLDLIRSDYTFLNERLARHYGIPHVNGSRFRRVKLDEATHRGGLLRQGSILSVTSYPTRTSPVLRGHWVLKNLMGMAPPPPPADVPALAEKTILGALSVRERLRQHREDRQCAICHEQMDPIGFALENFDALGRWREAEDETPLDTTASLLRGKDFKGVSGLEEALLEHPDLVARTLTEKLLTFALGRGIEYYDAPAIRKIVRDAREDNYRFSKLILGIAESIPFQMRASQ
jgi:hypothetical protein